MLGYGLVAFELNSTDYRLWERAVLDVTPEQMRAGASAAKDWQGRWFRLTDFRQLCRAASALPEPHAAYLEAATAGSPKEAQNWTHPVVFHAGKACGWTYLASTAEAQAWPRFRAIYGELCKRVEAGEDLAVPLVEMLEQKPPEVSTPDSPNYLAFRDKMRALFPE